jgi:site-specific recombinase XerD
MRLSELSGINLSNIHENTLTVFGKGNKERTIYLMRPVCRPLGTGSRFVRIRVLRIRMLCS